MAQIFDRSSNALARMSLVLTGLLVIALGVTLDELQRSPWVTRQGQRPDQPVPFSHKHHVQGLGLQCQYCHVTVEKSSYAGIPPTKTCMNCHSVRGTSANGRFGPDLTHLMSRATIAAGAAENNRDNLRLWIQNPGAIKPGSVMPAMKLSDEDLDAVVDYMETLH